MGPRVLFTGRAPCDSYRVSASTANTAGKSWPLWSVRFPASPRGQGGTAPGTAPTSAHGAAPPTALAGNWPAPVLSQTGCRGQGAAASVGEVLVELTAAWEPFPRTVLALRPPIGGLLHFPSFCIPELEGGGPELGLGLRVPEPSARGPASGQPVCGSRILAVRGLCLSALSPRASPASSPARSGSLGTEGEPVAPRGNRHQSPFRIPPGRTDRTGWGAHDRTPRYKDGNQHPLLPREPSSA